MLENLRKWVLLSAVLSMAVLAGCTAKNVRDNDVNVDDNDDDDNDDNGDDQAYASGEGEARGSPGWGALGAFSALGLASLAYLKRRKD